MFGTHGSHRLLYYNSATFPSSRFTDDAVRSEYRVKTACGKAGTGYLFDTHALHRGTPQGPNDHSRTAMIAEYHELSKCSQVRELGLQIPWLRRIAVSSDSCTCSAGSDAINAASSSGRRAK